MRKQGREGGNKGRDGWKGEGRAGREGGNKGGTERRREGSEGWRKDIKYD